MMRFCFLFFLVLSFPFTFTACDNSPEAGSAEDLIISMIQQTFVPAAIEARAGDIVFFYNQDTIIHRILNESGESLFDNTGVFDSGDLPVSAVGMITIPSSAGVGDVYYFYDDYLESQMTTPNGVIIITP